MGLVIRGKEQPVGCPEKWLSGLAPQRCFGALVSAAAAEGWGKVQMASGFTVSGKEEMALCSEADPRQDGGNMSTREQRG